MLGCPGAVPEHLIPGQNSILLARSLPRLVNNSIPMCLVAAAEAYKKGAAIAAPQNY